MLTLTLILVTYFYFSGIQTTDFFFPFTLQVSYRKRVHVIKSESWGWVTKQLAEAAGFLRRLKQLNEM